MNRIIYLFLILIFFASCSGKKAGTAQELKEYILNEEHGLHKKVLKNDITMEVFYRPAELVWARDLEDIKDLQKRKDQKQMYDSLSYFMIHLSRNGKEIENSYVSDPAKFKDVVNYLSFGIGNDLFLLHDQDTVHALDAIYSRSFGIADGTTVMAVFNKDLDKSSGLIKLCFDDELFGTGLTEFIFDVNYIKNIPTLTFK